MAAEEEATMGTAAEPASHPWLGTSSSSVSPPLSLCVCDASQTRELLPGRAWRDGMWFCLLDALEVVVVIFRKKWGREDSRPRMLSGRHYGAVIAAGG
jgi:hypothetical protein